MYVLSYVFFFHNREGYFIIGLKYESHLFYIVMIFW